MFEWLEAEMARIKTQKFHRVDGPASAELREAVQSCDFPLPPSYREFVLRFGNAKLYRRSSYWLVEVYAGPREGEAETKQGEPLIHFGRSASGSMAYFQESLLVASGETPVFEWRYKQGIRRTADNFEAWLLAKCKSARRRFKKKEWEAIEKGPPPFTDHEQAIVAARKLFQWRVVGIALNEDLRFEIHNGSAMTLPYLSVGIRGTLRPPNGGPLNGGVRLPISSIGPGETKIVEVDCYKEYISPEDTEALARPDPGPEDREQYWEFNDLE